MILEFLLCVSICGGGVDVLNWFLFCSRSKAFKFWKLKNHLKVFFSTSNVNSVFSMEKNLNFREC